MRLTTFTDYGLRMLMRMASAPGRAFSTAELADEFRLSRHHLTKIMQRLAQGGMVATRRGGGGGAMLARAPQDISLGAVVRLLEEGQALVECFAATGGECTVNGCCRLKARLRGAEAAFLADLDRTPLSDVALPALPPSADRGRGTGVTRPDADPDQFAPPSGSIAFTPRLSPARTRK